MKGQHLSALNATQGHNTPDSSQISSRFSLEDDFRTIFLIWLSDLYIGRIIVLKGANLVQFENESERRPALSAVNESGPEKGDATSFTHHLVLVDTVWDALLGGTVNPVL